jgi:hypothetical protein
MLERFAPSKVQPKVIQRDQGFVHNVKVPGFPRSVKEPLLKWKAVPKTLKRSKLDHGTINKKLKS